MQTLNEILLILAVGLMAWLGYSMIKRHPQAFSSDNLNKSFFTLGLLALFLIGIIALMVFLLHS